jgi:hypothetical protein
MLEEVRREKAVRPKNLDLVKDFDVITRTGEGYKNLLR